MGAFRQVAPPRLVLDTNVAVSALLFSGGVIVWARAAWRAGKIQPLISRQTTGELIRVLGYPKFGLSAHDRAKLLDDHLPWCEMIVAPPPPPSVPRCRDPSDRPFPELALAGNADALATGDRDLLALDGEFSRPILSPAAVRRRWAGWAPPRAGPRRNPPRHGQRMAE